MPKGRNPQEVAIRGWPDAYVFLDDEHIDAVEATHSDAWERHLEGDFDNAKKLGQGRLAGFLFVAWTPAPPLDAIDHYRSRFLKLGAPPERIRFVFQQELVTALRHPRFADVWLDPLHLRSDVFPFVSIRSAHVFGPENQLAMFAPSKSEYFQSKVHRPRLADTVEAQLINKGWSLVLGKGAVGKTVLATQIALGPRP